VDWTPTMGHHEDGGLRTVGVAWVRGVTEAVDRAWGGCVTKREPGELYGSGPPSGTISHPL